MRDRDGVACAPRRKRRREERGGADDSSVSEFVLPLPTYVLPTFGAHQPSVE